MALTRDELKLRVASIAADLKEAQFDVEHLQYELDKAEAPVVEPEPISLFDCEIIELKQLYDRMDKLQKFIYSVNFEYIEDAADRDDMHHQLRAMRNYYTALNSRLTRARS